MSRGFHIKLILYTIILTDFCSCVFSGEKKVGRNAKDTCTSTCIYMKVSHLFTRA